MERARTSSGQGPAVIGLAEVAELLGISRQRASEIVRRADFPRGRELKAGPVWYEAEVRAWARTRSPKVRRTPGQLDSQSTLTPRAVPPSDARGAANDLPELTGPDLETYSALLRVDRIGDVCARLYLEAHELAAGRPAMDPLALAAHDVRDLLQKLHLNAATPGESYVEVPKAAFHQLRDSWVRARDSLAALGQGRQAVDPPTEDFIASAERLLGVSGGLLPLKGKRVEDFLNSRDPGRHLLPEAARKEQSVAWEEERRYFNGVGHHDKTTDAATLRAHLESISRLILTALRPLPFRAIADLDELVTTAEATGDERDIAAAIRRAQNGVELDHFFQRISSPVWLEHLRGARWFANPPEPEITGTTMSFPAWIPGQYLERVAAERPVEVLDICRGAAVSSNPRVRYSLLRSAAAMPPHIAKRFVKQASRWASEPSGFAFVAEAIGALAAHLAAGGECKASLSILRPLLTLHAAPSSTVDVEGVQVTVPREPMPRYEPYQYRAFVADSLPDIVKHCELPAFVMLSAILADALAARDPAKRPPHDLSTIWRSAIDVGDDRAGVDALDALIDALRDAGVAILATDSGARNRIPEILRRARWDCHMRILIHLARMDAPSNPSMAIALLTDRTLLHNYVANYERDQLTRDCFVYLSRDQRSEVLQWIDEGPDREVLRQRFMLIRPPGDADAYITGVVEGWQRDRLTPIASHLPARQRRRLQQLIELRGEAQMAPRHVEFRYGAESPLSAEELASMTPRAVLEYLDSWEPPSDPRGPSAEGLANQLQQTIRLNPAGYAVDARLLLRLDPTYRRSALAGFRDASTSGVSFDWGPVLRLMEDLLAESSAPASRVHAVVEAVQERASWTAQEAGRLLQAGLRSTPGAVPTSQMPRILRIATTLLHHEDPVPSNEEDGLFDGMPPISRGINSVRGFAVELSLDIIQWAKQTSCDDAEDLRGHLLAELASLATVERSAGVRAVFGLCLTKLVAIDADWFAEHRRQILPPRSEDQSLHDAVWNAYLAFSNVYVNVFGVLRDEYEDAVDVLAMPTVKADEVPAESPVAQLGAHLLALYNSGNLPLREGGVLDRYFRHAPGTARHYVLGLQGRAAYESRNTISPEVVARMAALWDDRIRVVRDRGGDALDEIQPFAWAIASGVFDPAWSLEHLNRLLASGVRLEAEHLIAEELVRLASSHEPLVLGALSGMIRNSHKDWGISGWVRQAGEILDVLDGSSDPDVVDASVRLRNELATRGFITQLMPGQPRDL